MPKLTKDFFNQRLIVPKRTSRDGWYTRGYAPHFDGENVTQHVIIRLFDSLPQIVLESWEAELRHLPEAAADLERRKRIEEYLDRGYGSCFMKDDRVAEIVQNAVLYFEGERYALHAWCVMSNHVHTLFTPSPGYKVGGLVHSWESFTAHRCNKLLQRTGSFWQPDPFDRYIRNERHYQNAVVYIENNPVKAGLCDKPEDWPWSSARWR